MSHCHHQAHSWSRRGLLWLGCGAALRQLLPAVARAAEAEALLLTCMDVRLLHEIDAYMESRGLLHRYDHVILAGASLGVVSGRFPNWTATFWDHVALSMKLHGIRRVIAMDHRDCGAYQAILGEDFAKDRAEETQVHAEMLGRLREQIRARQPTLEFEPLLMNLDGTVETVA